MGRGSEIGGVLGGKFTKKQTISLVFVVLLLTVNILYLIVRCTVLIFQSQSKDHLSKAYFRIFFDLPLHFFLAIIFDTLSGLGFVYITSVLGMLQKNRAMNQSKNAQKLPSNSGNQDQREILTVNEVLLGKYENY